MMSSDRLEMKFESVPVPVEDIDRAKDFYVGKLGDTEVVQEPTDQRYGIRDCAFRDPAGNLIRIQELQ